MDPAPDGRFSCPVCPFRTRLIGDVIGMAPPLL